MDKSSIFFSPSTDVNMKAEVCSRLEIVTEAFNDKYLGLPTTLGLDKADSFQYLIDWLVLRLNGWKERCLSSGGKEILIKSVAQAVPTYAMSVFKIPKKIAKESLTRCRTFGGVAKTTRRECTGWRGGRCVYQKIMEE